MTLSRAIIGMLALALSFLSCRGNVANDGHPFGIKSKEHRVSVNSVAEMNSWQLRFSSVADFVSSVRPDGSTILSSGEADDVYYALFRTSSNLLVIAYDCKSETKSNSAVGIVGRGRGKDTIHRIPWKLAFLLNTSVETKEVGPPQMTLSKDYSFLGYAGQIPRDYAGPITVNVEVWNEGKDKTRRNASTTVGWSAVP